MDEIPPPPPPEDTFVACPPPRALALSPPAIPGPGPGPHMHQRSASAAIPAGAPIQNQNQLQPHSPSHSHTRSLAVPPSPGSPRSAGPQAGHTRSQSSYTNPTHEDFQRFYSVSKRGEEMEMMQTSPLMMAPPPMQPAMQSQPMMMMVPVPAAGQPVPMVYGAQPVAVNQVQLGFPAAGSASPKKPRIGGVGEVDDDDEVTHATLNAQAKRVNQSQAQSPTTIRVTGNGYIVNIIDPLWCDNICKPLYFDPCSCRWKACCREMTYWEKMHCNYIGFCDYFLTLFCPCCVYAETVQLGLNDNYCCSCLGYCALMFIPVRPNPGFCLYQWSARKRLQDRWGIKEHECEQCCLVACCPVCAMIQDLREARIRNGPPRQLIY